MDLGFWNGLISCGVCVRKMSKVHWNKCPRAGDADLCTKFGEQMYVRSSNPAVEDVTDYRDFKAVNMFLMLADGHRVEQSLCWMFISTVTRVDYCRLADLCELVRYTRRTVPYDDAIRCHRI